MSKEIEQQGLPQSAIPDQPDTYLYADDSFISPKQGIKDSYYVSDNPPLDGNELLSLSTRQMVQKVASRMADRGEKPTQSNVARVIFSLAGVNVSKTVLKQEIDKFWDAVISKRADQAKLGNIPVEVQKSFEDCFSRIYEFAEMRFQSRRLDVEEQLASAIESELDAKNHADKLEEENERLNLKIDSFVKELAARKEECTHLRESLEKASAAEVEAKTLCASLQSQLDSASLHYEKRLDEVTKGYQERLEDLSKAHAKSLEDLENRTNKRIEDLENTRKFLMVQTYEQRDMANRDIEHLKNKLADVQIRYDTERHNGLKASDEALAAVTTSKALEKENERLRAQNEMLLKQKDAAAERLEALITQLGSAKKSIHIAAEPKESPLHPRIVDWLQNAKAIKLPENLQLIAQELLVKAQENLSDEVFRDFAKKQYQLAKGNLETAELYWEDILENENWQEFEDSFRNSDDE